MVLWKSALGSQQTIPLTICLQTRLLLVWVVRGTLAGDTIAASPSRCCALWGCASRGWDPDTNVEWWRSSTPRICGTWPPELYNWSRTSRWTYLWPLGTDDTVCGQSSKHNQTHQVWINVVIGTSWVCMNFHWMVRELAGHQATTVLPNSSRGALGVPHEGKPTPCPVPRWIPCSRSSWIQGKPTLSLHVDGCSPTHRPGKHGCPRRRGSDLLK